MTLQRARVRRAASMVMVAVLVGTGSAGAQALDGTGAVATGLLLRRMDGVKRVLMIGAHPDDEDTSLLTTLARGWGVETAYLSLTRGDGGQNVIGPELWEGLGVVRTGELVAARRLDGGRQFFARAYDYGFSKTTEEALTLWPRDELLADVVWVVRTFRPHVIVSVWSGTPRDGHGQHQASGIISGEAFDAAGDPSRFPEQLTVEGVEAWAPAKLYHSRRFGRGGGAGPNDGTLVIQTGALDPLLGRSLLQLSMESRSQHRSQEMGAPQPPGPGSTGVALIASRVTDDGRSIFSGVDTTLVGLAGSLPGEARAATVGHLAAYRAAVARAVERFGLDPSRIVPDLIEAYVHLERAEASSGPGASRELRGALRQKKEVAGSALLAAGGVSYDVRALDDLVVPGESIEVRALLWNGGGSALEASDVTLDLPAEWSVNRTGVQGLAGDGRVAPGSLATWTYSVTIPPNADPSRLYYLRSPRENAWYRWPDRPDLWALPRDPPPVRGRAVIEIADERVDGSPAVVVTAPWRYVGVDPTRGEFEKPVLIVPAVSLTVAPSGSVWPAGRSEPRPIAVVVRSEAAEGTRGAVTVGAPMGWSVTPSSRAFELPEPGTERTLSFDVAPIGAPQAGEHVFTVAARTERGEVREGYTLIDYEHIERTAIYTPATATVSVVPVMVAEGLRVGYVMGSGDDGPEAIRQMGARVDLLGDAAVRDGAFGEYDAIVLGVRAYETRPELRAASEQLLDYARGGGTVVVQYNRESMGSLAPVPIDIGRASPRVTDERAPVTVLAPEAPIFTSPNRIGADDFAGWVQERGLYYAAEWDEAFMPLLEMADPGEEPTRGALLVAPVGDGVFVYTALAFFRQWSERVPGAYRLFANVISLDPDAWRAFTRTGRPVSDLER